MEKKNGFTILDTYTRQLINGTIVRKVLLKCDKCGREFERCSGVDFAHIKCKCMCKDQEAKTPKFKIIEYKGKQYYLTEFCRENNIPVSTFQSRLSRGMSIDEAIKHINKFSSGHSEAIVTKRYESSQIFLQRVNSAAVYVNASTRFTDGEEFGFGAEIGISTQKLHARGPMGLEELCCYKYMVYGDGHIR